MPDDADRTSTAVRREGPPAHTALFEPLSIGDLTLPHRVLMAPLTRSRSTPPENTQTPLHALYYAQRAGAGLLDDYRHAARCVKAAHFDGAELYAANGYLIDQFLRSSVNRRKDRYGVSLENRVRLLDEVLNALLEELPAERLGVRLTPMGGAGGSHDSDPMATYVAATKVLAGRGLAYLHVVRPNSHGGGAAGYVDYPTLHRSTDALG